MNDEQWSIAHKHVANAQEIVVLIPEMVDGDSLGSALALEEILGDLGKKVSLYSFVDVPEYLRYAQGWSRVAKELPDSFDLSIIVDCSSKPLMERTFDDPALRSQIEKRPCLIFDHHAEVNQADQIANFLPNTVVMNHPEYVSTSELLFAWAQQADYAISAQAADAMLIAILADSLGMTTKATTSHTLRTAASLIDLGAHPNDIENRRREYMRKSPEILAYKGQLLQRVSYHADSQLALVHIPWDEIAQYSSQYNPSVLVLDEMRLVNKVRVAIALKSYKNGRITGKIRTNNDAPVADRIAAHFGGGGHVYAAGFKIHADNFDEIVHELAGAVLNILKEYDEECAKAEAPC